MGYLKEKVYFLKGLAAGLQYSEGTGEGKLLKEIIDVLDDFAMSIEEIEKAHEELSEHVDNLDEDLSSVEDVVYVEEDGEEGSSIHQIGCPHCKEIIEIDTDEISKDVDTLICPHCKQDIEVVWDHSCGCCDDDDCEECEDDNCDCGCQDHNEEDKKDI